MRWPAAACGTCLLVLVLMDAFNTLLLARRTEHIFRIAGAFYSVTWRPWAAIARRIQSKRRRESFLGVYGPLSLLLLFALWAVGLVIGFGLVQWSAGMQPGTVQGSFGNDLYLSASTLV